MDEVRSNENDARRTPEFVKLLTTHERTIYSYILCNIPNLADADEVYQETALKLWENFGDYQSGTNFKAWANTIAYYQILTFRNKHRSDRLIFSEEFVNAVSSTFNQNEEGYTKIIKAMQRCISKLPEHSSSLLQLIYYKGVSVIEAAKTLNIGLNVAYKRLSRIRLSLSDCVKRETSAQD